ncbi:hypothetical protein DLREEDagrD3_13410 [Denitratisoma sp. agr-D3]
MHKTLPSLLAIALAACSGATRADTLRIGVEEFSKDPAKVAALQKAVAAMRGNDTAPDTSAAFRASWQYWANIHGYLGSGPNAAATVAQWNQEMTPNCSGDPVCLGYYKHLRDTNPPADGFTAQAWGSCQHGTMGFLPWHRMYLYFFERVVRKQAGDPNLNLPYWDYFATTGAGGKGIALPAIVRSPGGNSLYDEFRTPGLNAYKTAIDSNTGSAAQAFKFTDFTNFSHQLESQPHGAMHCAAGSSCNAPDIGQVPLAGLDPVFYMHHANIDRLWQCWLNRKAGGKPIDLAWAKANLGMPDDWYQTSYTFADENGNKATMTIADVFTPGVIDVHYAKETNCDVAPPSTAALKSLAAAPAVLRSVPVSHPQGTTLTGKAVTLPLQATTDKALLSRAAPAAGTTPGHTLLIIEDVDIQGNPEVTYNIYLSNKRQPKRSAYIATLNYFGVLEPMPQGHHHGGHGPKIGTLTYDVQEELQRLGITSTADVAVRFVPSSFVAETSRARKTRGSVKVGTIRLQAADGTTTP